MQLSKITFRKSDLEQIPEAERVMFISLSHAANELNILSKLFQISMKGPITNELERQVMNVQGLMFARLLAGKLSELWQMFSLVFFKSKISLEFEPLLDTEAGISLVSLKKYFSKSNVINTVRNKCAFHYSLGEISEGYSELDDSRVLDIYLSQSNANANTIYCFADYIANLAMLKSIDAEDSHSALQNFMDDTSNAMKWFNLVLGNCITIIAKKYLKNNLMESNVEKVNLNGFPSWESVSIPFFIEDPKFFQVSLQNGKELTWGEHSQDAPDLIDSNRSIN